MENSTSEVTQKTPLNTAENVKTTAVETGAGGIGTAARYAFIDGIRGFLALWITLCHMVQAYLQVDLRPVPPDTMHLLELVFMGHDRTAMFFIVSGFCLMLPVIKDGDGTLRGGPRGFLVRRGIRLLPPYYIALVLVLLLNIPLHYWGVDLRGFHVNGGNALGKDGVISHFFLIHNLQEAWMYAIFPPVWFVAAEWQACVLFAFLLIPVWRAVLVRKGTSVAIGVILVLGAALGYLWYLFPKPWNLEWTMPHYLFLFAIGMIGIAIAMPREAGLQRMRDTIPWTGIAGICVATLFALRWYSDIAGPVADLLLAVVVLSCLLQCSREYAAEGQARPGIIRRFLESRLLTGLGLYSYSMFLVHYVVVSHWSTFMRWLKWENWPMVLAFWLGNAILIALGTVLFYRFCEKPFEAWRARVRAQPAEPDTVTQPA